MDRLHHCRFHQSTTSVPNCSNSLGQGCTSGAHLTTGPRPKDEPSVVVPSMRGAQYAYGCPPWISKPKYSDSIYCGADDSLLLWTLVRAGRRRQSSKAVPPHPSEHAPYVASEPIESCFCVPARWVGGEEEAAPAAVAWEGGRKAMAPGHPRTCDKLQAMTCAWMISRHSRICVVLAGISCSCCHVPCLNSLDSELLWAVWKSRFAKSLIIIFRQARVGRSQQRFEYPSFLPTILADRFQSRNGRFFFRLS